MYLLNIVGALDLTIRGITEFMSQSFLYSFTSSTLHALITGAYINLKAILDPTNMIQYAWLPADVG